jgi:hypothetical protein
MDHCVLQPSNEPELKALIEESLRPPRPEEVASGHHKPKQSLREAFFSEGKPRRNRAVVWKLFRDAVGSYRVRIQSFGVKEFETAVAEEWPDDAPGVAGWVNQRLRKYYAWADKLADIYADRYRSTFVLPYFLGVFAVFLALFSMAAGWITETKAETKADDFRQAVCTFVELVVIIGILVFVEWSRRRRWHDRWMDYRLVAELVRQLRFLIPLGGGRPFPRLSPHLASFGNPSQTWMYWHVRAIERATGLPSAQVTPDYLTRYLDYLDGVVEGQVQFHKTSQERLGKIDHRLHLWGFVLFFVTGVVCLVHLLHHFDLFWLPEWLPRWLTLLSAVLPALGAALAAINNQGEFLRTSKRYDAMARRLAEVQKEINDIKARQGTPNPPTFGEVLPIAAKVAQWMVDEVLDWRVLFQDRPPVLPA